MTRIATAIAIFYVSTMTLPAHAEVKPPKSGLGQQVVTPEIDSPADAVVVYPRTTDVVEGTIKDIEDMQLTPEQSARIKELFIKRERVRISPYNSIPEPITRTTFVSLDPGAKLPVIRLSRGQLSSIVFSDANGNPWMIERVAINKALFSDGRDGSNSGAGPAGANAQQQTNVLTIEPKSPSSYGNVTVTLRGLSTPVIFVLTAGQQEVDIRIDAKVPGRNPDAADTVTTSSMPTIDNALSYFLDGVPPTSAKRLKVTGLAETEAWVYGDALYLRTRANAQYPAYIAAARSTSGIAVYRFAAQHRAITLTSGGRAVTAFLE